MNDRDFLIGGLGVLIGAGIGALVAWQMTKSHYAHIADTEIEEIREHYESKISEINKNTKATKNRFEKLGAVQKEYQESLKALRYKTETQAVDADEPEQTERERVLVESSMDDGDRRNWNDPELVDHGTVQSYEVPYVITYDDFVSSDNEQSTITYYSMDDTLADDKDDIIAGVVETVGPYALKMFGYKSYDKNVVYVRNERFSSDFEVLYDPSSYQETVLGKEYEEFIDFDDDHPNTKKIRKMRADE